MGRAGQGQKEKEPFQGAAEAGWCGRVKATHFIGLQVGLLRHRMHLAWQIGGGIAGMRGSMSSTSRAGAGGEKQGVR